MRIAVYTSCAVNYLAKARVLAASLARNSPGASLTVCLCDEPDPGHDLSAEPFDRIWQPDDLGFDRAWVFRHDIMELCTAVKGRALLRLWEEEPDADLLVYLDPDVIVFRPLDQLADLMGDDQIGLVPHILDPEESDIGIELTEISVAEHGTYNLGHLILRPGRQSRRFAEWWAARLDRFCYDSKERGLFTDQRWVDLAPALFAKVRVLRHKGLDVASWNLFGRRIAQDTPGDERTYTADSDPLVTYHFSGTGPLGTHRRIREIFDPGNAVTAEIERNYEAEIAAAGEAVVRHRPPAFDRFDDGTAISAGARRLYRRHADLRERFPDPYAVGADGGYLGWLRQNRPGMTEGVAIPPPRLAQAFDELFDETWYIASYPEAAEAIETGRFEDALDHYVRLGARLSFDPNEFFVTSFYLDRAGDLEGWRLRRAGTAEGTPLWHYLEVGLQNGVEPIDLFDSSWYLNAHSDIATAFRMGAVGSPLGHFLRYGSAEGRDPGPGFSSARYLEVSPEARTLTASGGGIRGAFGAFVRLGGVAGRISA